VVLALHVGVRAIQTRPYVDGVGANPIWLSIFTFIGAVAMSAVVIFFLSRALLTEASGYGRPLYARFAGIYVLAAILVEFLQSAGSVAVFSFATSPAAFVYGSPLVGALASVAAFPLFVRCFATAAGIDEPRLGRIWSFVFDGGRGVYFWYALCTIGLGLLGSFTFTNILPAGESNDLPGNLLQSAITATSQIMRSMLDIVAVKMVARGWREDVEVFA
jgi:hypothetical protein